MMDSLDTPRLLVDATRMEHNISRFHEAVRGNGVDLRSHVKTHKTPEIAQRQVAAGAVGIAAAKVSEAEVFVDAGIGDVVVAYPVFGEEKWRRLAELAKRCRLTVHAENVPAIEGLSRAAREADAEIHVRIELDTGFHRSGVDVDGAMALARKVADSGLKFDGITSHRSIFFPGHAGRPAEELATEEGAIMVAAADRIRAEGIAVRTVAAGSTPTSVPLSAVDGVTEVCAGTYVFYDAGMADLGVAAPDDIAISIPCTVVSRQSARRYTVDGGAKTFTKDTYPGKGGDIFGRAVGRPDVIVALTDEHGIVETSAQPPAVGDIVAFHPMHVCPVVNLADELIVTRMGKVEAVWTVAARGRNR